MRESALAHACDTERESAYVSECVSVRGKERERERMIESVCMKERERERESKREHAREREMGERKGDCIAGGSQKRRYSP